MKTFLYIRGVPGTGKITVARILQRGLRWKLFWLHDLDAIWKVIGSHDVPRLMDQVTAPILRHLCATGENIIYVRPSRDAETVMAAKTIAEEHGYRVVVVRLVADYATLVERVENRPASEFRASSRNDLYAYLKRPVSIAGVLGDDLWEEQIIHSHGVTPDQVAVAITSLL